MHTLDSYARAIGAGVLAAGLAMLGGCADPNTSAPTPSTEAEGDNANAGTEALPRRFPAESLEMPADVIVADPAANATRSAFFGDLHVQGTEGVLFYTRQKTTLTRWQGGTTAFTGVGAKNR